jgi:radical SAM protein with 4Fe4S-binding SPASM domain
MINLTRIWTGVGQSADALRYGRGGEAPASAASRRPVVVWNLTRTCNLYCAHCYSDSAPQHYEGELTLAEARDLIDDLAHYGVRHLLLSGGEPTLHPHFFSIAKYAAEKGLKPTLSTNGTRLTRLLALRLREIGLGYIGISLDGIGRQHDLFRGTPGAFDRAVSGIRHCRAFGHKRGLRLTLTRHNIHELDAFFRFIEDEDIPRICFYHLVPAGRGAALELPTPVETRTAIDRILRQVEKWHREGIEREVLTVTQPADAAYLLWLLERDKSPGLQEARELLRWNGGAAHGSGCGLANIDPQGNVHPDQFSRSITLGNIRKKPFSEIWEHKRMPSPAGFENAGAPIGGRCKSCRYLDVCGGGFRSHAELGDPGGADPRCYLDDEMIGVTTARAIPPF